MPMWYDTEQPNISRSPNYVRVTLYRVHHSTQL